MLTDAGGTLIAQMLVGESVTPFNNANAYIGVGDGGPSALTGTLGFTNGSASVSGTGTSFTTQLAVGDFVIGGDGLLYQVQAIGSNTALTLASNYAGATQAGVSTSKVLRPLVSQTDLQASTNKVRKGMDASYPQRSAKVISMRITLGTGDANFAIREWGAFNAAAAGTMLNRKVEDLGTKTGSQIWQIPATLTVQNS